MIGDYPDGYVFPPHYFDDDEYIDALHAAKEKHIEDAIDEFIEKQLEQEEENELDAMEDVED